MPVKARNSRNDTEPSRTLQTGIDSAQLARLNYVSDADPGLRRIRCGRRFAYLSPRGARIRDRRVLARIHRLAVPPAWEDVWLCADPRGHLQATGRDALGRKQYRYHLDWRRTRDENKYDRVAQFGAALPRIRRRVRADLAAPGLARNKVIAAVVRLLETTFIRIGNRRYARDNGSYGLTTLRNRHVKLTGETIRFQFKGKSRKQHAIELTDARLARVIRRCRDLPGFELFQYVENGAIRSIGSSDVNAYLGEVAGTDYTAKDFRTWGGTALAMEAFERLRRRDAQTRVVGREAVNQVIADVAAQLGNTVPICRKCYVHPRVIEAFVDRRQSVSRSPRRGLTALEERLLAVLGNGVAG